MKVDLCPEYFFQNFTVKKTLFYTLLAVLFLSASYLLYAEADKTRPDFRWPVNVEKNGVVKGITSTFAETRKDHFHSGLDISGLGLPIHAVAKGNILYTRSDKDTPFSPETGAGNYMFIDHGQGWWSGYYHLKSFGKERSGLVDTDTTIAYSGNSGHSMGAHLHFFISKNYGAAYLNPMGLLPMLTDTASPNIDSLLILVGEKKTRLTSEREETIRLTKAYPVVLSGSDAGEGGHTRRGFFRIKWRINQGRTESLLFDRLDYKDGDWKLEGLHSYHNVYASNSYLLGEIDFKNGENEIEVEAEDFNGNITKKTFRFNVKREY